MSRRYLDLRPLRASRAFRDMWIGSSLVSVGQQIATLAVLTQVWDLTKSPLWTGAIGLATAAPLLLFGLVGGSLADAFDRRTIIRLTTAGQLLAAVAFCVQAVAGNQSALVLFAILATYSAFSALGAPARRTVPVRLLPADCVASGLALQNLAFHMSMLAGPPLAGVLIAEWGFPAAYAVEAVLVAVGLAATFRLPPLPIGNDEAGVARRKPAKGGWSIILRKPTLWGSFATDLLQTVLSMPIALFPLINELRFNGDPRTLGLFLSAIAVGGICAGMLSGTVTRWRRSGRVQLIAAAVWGVALAGFGLAAPLWLALAWLAIAGAADTVSVVTRGALVQLETPDEFRGRVSSVEGTIGVAGPELGNARGGLLAALTSAPVALVLGGLMAAAAVGLVAAFNRPLRNYRTPENTSPATVSAQPS